MVDKIMHELNPETQSCTCKGFKPRLGSSIMREFDRHLISVGQFTNVSINPEDAGLTYAPLDPEATMVKLGRCVNTQCKVVSFKGDRCPACYGGSGT